MHGRISLGHSDAAGVIYYPRLAALAHDHYEETMRELGIDLAAMIRTGTIGLPIIEATIRCLRPLRHGQAYRCDVACPQIGTSSYGISITFDCDGQTAAIVEQRHCAIDPSSQRAIPLPADLRAALEQIGQA